MDFEFTVPPTGISTGGATAGRYGYKVKITLPHANAVMTASEQCTRRDFVAAFLRDATIEMSNPIDPGTSFRTGEGTPFCIGFALPMFGSQTTIEPYMDNGALKLRTAFSESVGFIVDSFSADCVFDEIEAEPYEGCVEFLVQAFYWTVGDFDFDDVVDSVILAEDPVSLMPPASWAPSFDLVATQVNAYGGRLYRGASGIELSISNVSTKHSATVGSKSISFDGASSTGDSLSVSSISTAGTLVATATVTDSRGMESTRSIAIDVYDHANPVISNAAVTRCDADGTPNEEGSCAKVSLDVTAVTDIPDTQLSECAEVRVRARGATSWDTAEPLSLLGDQSQGHSYEGVVRATGDGGEPIAFDGETQYDVLVTVGDTRGGSSSVSLYVLKSFVTMDFLAGGHGIAFGKTSTSEGFHCAMASTFDPPIPNDSLDAAPTVHVHDGSGIADGTISWGKLASALQTVLTDSKFNSRSMSSDLNALMPGVDLWEPSTKNIPVASTWGIVVTFANGTNPESSGLWRRQIAMDTSGRMFQRQCINQKVSANTGWSSWYQIWTGQGAVPVSGGGTGSTSAAGARTNLGAAASGHTHELTVLGGTSNTSFTNVCALGSYTWYVIAAMVKDTKRVLATAVLPKAYLEACTSSSNPCGPAYGGEPSIYTAAVYVSGGRIYMKVGNATWCRGEIWGVK